MNLFGIRKGERRDTWAAFLTLFALIASHSILETARDALFLAKVPTSQLPWVYALIAALSVVSVKVQAFLTRGLSPRRTLSLYMVTASVVALLFFFFYSRLGWWGVYALYLWTGLLVTLVLVHYWTLVADLFTITQAKRVYGFIGTGSVLGAIVGSGAASLLSRMVAPQRLLVFSAIGFAITAVVPFLFTQSPDRAPSDRSPDFMDTVGYVIKDRYAFGVASTLLLASVCLTVSDFIFKSVIAEVVPAARLGSFLGMVYFAINVLSLLCQIFVVGFALKRTSLGAALSVLPIFFVFGGLGVAVSGGLVAVLALKTADGTLRYSLHRTAAELLFLPFGEEARRRVKTFVDLVAQRGGQVLASAAILGLTALGARPRAVAIMFVFLAMAWAVSALMLQKPYIAIFRDRLRAGQLHHIEEFPELDVASLETLIGSLESDNDGEVLAALSVLDREQKAHLIPVLILYHPSERVVVRALEILTRSGRHNFVQAIERVIDHPSPSVRASAIAARSVLKPDPQKLLLRLSFEDSAEVRATIVVNLIAAGYFSPGERTERIESLIRTGTPDTLIAFAEAIGRRSSAGFDDVLIKLTESADPRVRRAAVSAMQSTHSPEVLAVLVRALLHEPTRDAAERALVGYGAEAFDELVRCFEDRRTESNLRWRIPHVLTLCNPERAMETLCRWLASASDGRARYRVIRALEWLTRRHPSLTVDTKAVSLAVDQTVTLSYRYLDQRVSLTRGAAISANRKTPGHELLHDLLRDRETNAKARIFKLLGLLHPTDELPQIYAGLSGPKELRATSMELIEGILTEPLRTAVMGLCDEGDDLLRLSRAGRYHVTVRSEYEDLLRALANAESAAIRDVTRFHASELGIADRLGESRVAA